MKKMFGSQLIEKFKEMTVGDRSAHQSDQKLIIALDFGTTFSGIAYCFANQRDPKVFTIDYWPGRS